MGDPNATFRDAHPLFRNDHSGPLGLMPTEPDGQQGLYPRVLVLTNVAFPDLAVYILAIRAPATGMWIALAIRPILLRCDAAQRRMLTRPSAVPEGVAGFCGARQWSM